MGAHQDRRAGAGRVHIEELGHDHRGAALGARPMIGDETIRHATRLPEAGHGRGVSDPIAQFAVADRDRAEQGVQGHGRSVAEIPDGAV